MNAMTLFIQELQTQTTQMLKLTHEMQACLLEEQVALANLNSDAIMQITGQKNGLVKTIESLSHDIHILLSKTGVQDGLAGLMRWLDQLPPSSVKTELINDWNNIKSLTQANRHTNESNGACVSLSQRQAQRSLEILRGQFSHGAQTYGPDGNTRSSGYSGRHSIA